MEDERPTLTLFTPELTDICVFPEILYTFDLLKTKPSRVLTLETTLISARLRKPRKWERLFTPRNIIQSRV